MYWFTNLAIYKETPEFIQFAEKLFKDIELDESSEDEEDKKAIKSQFTKKIRKNGKVKKLKYNGEDYDIDHWAQCDKCRIWRKTKKELGDGESFMCRAVNKRCHQR